MSGVSRNAGGRLRGAWIAVRFASSAVLAFARDTVTRSCGFATLLVDATRCGIDAHVARSLLRYTAMPAANDTIYEILEHQHREVEKLLDALAQKRDAAGRASLFPKLLANLYSHAKAEERTFYMTLQRHRETHDDIASAKEDHREIEAWLSRLAITPYDDESWGPILDELANSVHQHIEVEEADVFQEAREAFDEHQAREMGRAFLDLQTQMLHEMDQGEGVGHGMLDRGIDRGENRRAAG
jgi:hemerythrin superfamily protein